MGRNRTEKIIFTTLNTGLETTYSLLKASQLLNKDYRTVKKHCTKNNIELVEHRNRFYLSQQDLNTLKSSLNLH